MLPRLPRVSSRKDFGDFQTPDALVAEVLDALGTFGEIYQRVLEPTCGEGRFIAGFLDRLDAPREIRGFEIQTDHAEVAQTIFDLTGRTSIEVKRTDLFATDLRTELRWLESGPLLVVGNLPWVTTSALGASGGVNGPLRSNQRGRRGIDAMTGESNFDISEAIWLKLIRELAPDRPTIALLCKTTVARAILRSIHTEDLPITHATIWKIDARRWFRASVDACLLRVKVGPGPKATEAGVFGDLATNQRETTLGFAGGQLIADRETYRRVAYADGPSPLQWRQGVKHDATAIMELIGAADGQIQSKAGAIVDVEADFVFPLRKATDLAGSRQVRSDLRVIVTQTRLGDDTRALQRTAPKLWSYLNDHAEALERRKSSIYRGRPPFAMFGVGDYSFAPYKVAISGLHKVPRFRLIEPVDSRPVMVDDTCYFLPCRTREQATLLEQVLNGPAALGLLQSLIFAGSKRPVTKVLLQRLDLKALLNQAGLAGSWEVAWETDWSSRRSPMAIHPVHPTVSK